jgi:hypothetical protein
MTWERIMPAKVCPAWLGHFLANPIRKLINPPQTILTPYVRERMTVLDVGCGMGFFNIPLAQMVGTNGKVICVDLNVAGSGRQGCNPAGESPAVIIVRFGHVAIPQFWKVTSSPLRGVNVPAARRTASLRGRSNLGG